MLFGCVVMCSSLYAKVSLLKDDVCQCTSMCAGTTIAIDDRYEVWGSGIISVPWNFSIQELKPQLLRLLSPAAPQQADTPGNRSQAAFLSRPETRVLPVCFGTLRSLANTSRRSALVNLCCFSHSIARSQSWQHVFCGSISNASRPHKYGLMHRSLQVCPKSQQVIKPLRLLQSQQSLPGYSWKCKKL